jgi:hypothetical protein
VTAAADVDPSSNETIPVVAREATGDERQRLCHEHARLYPEFAAYPSKVSRVIAVSVPERRAG